MKGITTMNLKNRTRTALCAFALTLTLASTAFAASNSGSMTIAQPVQINGVQLAAGDYQVKWQGSGDNMTVSILQGRKVMATAPAHLVEVKKAGNNSYLAVAGDNGAIKITELRFAGKTQALDIGDEMAKMNNATKAGTN